MDYIPNSYQFNLKKFSMERTELLLWWWNYSLNTEVTCLRHRGKKTAPENHIEIVGHLNSNNYCQYESLFSETVFLGWGNQTNKLCIKIQNDDLWILSNKLMDLYFIFPSKFYIASTCILRKLQKLFAESF